MKLAPLLATLPKSTPLSDILKLIKTSEASSGESKVLQRASLVRWFDRQTFDEVLAEDSGVNFTGFTARKDVVKTHLAGAYCLRDDARQRAFERWGDDTTGLKACARNLYRYYTKHKDASNSLACLLYADPVKALARLDDEYRRADRVFDYATLDDLLRLLRSRTNLAPKLVAFLNDREQYYQSRVLHSGDWMRSAYYMQRKEIKDEFDLFFKSRKQWLMHLHAPGGSGKTAFLQWLTSRYAVVERGPERTRIPVAKVDLDAVDLALVRRWPWLLLVAVVEQLDAQLPGKPFESLVRYVQPVQPYLRRVKATAAEAGGNAVLDQVAASMGPSVYAEFASCLKNARCLVVIDTVEELMIHQPDAFRNFLDQMAAARKDCKGLHVLISGRYVLPDPKVKKPPDPGSVDAQLLDLAKRLGSGLRPVFIAPFTPAESRRYLQKIRELPGKQPFGRMHKASRGNPFILSLFSELSLTKGGLREEDFRHPEINYLLRRVIERIPEAEMLLRWTLRYAAIPKVLTPEFFDAVVKPAFELVIAGKLTDDTEAGLPDRARNPWKHVTDGKVDREALWPDLRKYAGPRSWIIFDGDVASLQSEVAVPMRTLLHPSPVFSHLHGQAITYFEGLAEDSSNRGDAAACEALYHAFQCDGAAAGQYWTDALKKAGSTRRRRALAARLVSSDFLDKGAPLIDPRTNLPFVDGKTLAEAYLELASAAAGSAVNSSSGPDLVGLEQAAQYLRDFDTLAKSATEVLADADRIAYLRAVVADGRKQPKEVVRITQPFLKQTPGTRYTPYLLTLYGKNAGLSLTETATLYDQAAAIATGPARATIYRAKVQLWVDAGDLAKADWACEQALRDDTESNDVFLRTRLEIARECASATRVTALLSARPLNAGLHLEAFRGNAFLRLSEGRADYWFSETRSVMRETDDDIAVWATTSARALAKLTRFNEAFDLIDQTRATLKSRRPDLLSSLSLEAGRIMVEESGSSRKGSSVVDLEAVGQQDQLQLRLLQLLGNYTKPGRAQIWQREIKRRLFPELSDREKAIALGYWVALGSPSKADIAQFVDLFRRTTPVEARYTLLRPYLWSTAEGHAKLPIGDLIPDPPDGPDFLNHAPILARFWFYGDRKRARSLGERVLRAAGNNCELVLPALRTARRAGAVPPKELIQELLRAAQGAFDSQPYLAAHVMLELAYAGVLIRDFTLAAELYELATKYATASKLKFEGRYGGLDRQIRQKIRRAGPLPLAGPSGRHIVKLSLERSIPTLRAEWNGADRLSWKMMTSSGRQVEGIQLRIKELSSGRSVLPSIPWLQILSRLDRRPWSRFGDRGEFRVEIPEELAGIPFEALYSKPKRFCYRDNLNRSETGPWVTSVPGRLKKPSGTEAQENELARILVLTDSAESLRNRKRGYGILGRPPALATKCELTIAPVRDFQKVIHGFRPDLLWVCGELQHLGSETTMLFPSEEFTFSAHGFARALRSAQLPQPPLLLLDVPDDPGREKSVFLRNQFADSLYREGVVRSVLAGGFIKGDRLELFLKELSAAVQEFHSERQLTERIAAMAAAPPALFSSDPTIPIV